jgi:hypothetical protein
MSASANISQSVRYQDDRLKRARTPAGTAGQQFNFSSLLMMTLREGMSFFVVMSGVDFG